MNRHPNKLIKLVTHGFIGNGVLSISNRILTLIISILLARTLGATGYGYYIFSTVIINLVASISLIGLPQLITREIAKLQTTNSWPAIHFLRQWSIRVSSLSTSICTLTIFSIIYFFESHINAIDSNLLFVALLLIPLLASISLNSSFLRGLRYVVHANWPSSLIRPIVLLICILLFINLLTPLLAMQLNIFATTCTAFIIYYLFRKLWPDYIQNKSNRIDTSSWSASLTPFTLLTGITLINQYTDIIMLGILGKAVDVGIYNISLQGAALISLPLVTLNTVLGPYFSRLFNQKKMLRLQHLITYSTMIATAISGTGVILLIVFGEWVIPNIFGTDYVSSYSALLILVIGTLTNSLLGSVGLLLGMSGYERDTLFVTGFTVATNIILNATLIPIYGIQGAASATTASIVIWNIVMGTIVYRRLSIIPGPFGLVLKQKKLRNGQYWKNR